MLNIDEGISICYTHARRLSRLFCVHIPYTKGIILKGSGVLWTNNVIYVSRVKICRISLIFHYRSVSRSHAQDAMKQETVLQLSLMVIIKTPQLEACYG